MQSSKQSFPHFPHSGSVKAVLAAGLLFLAAIPCILFLTFQGNRQANRKERNFDKTCEELFREEMTSNTLNMHYSLACPEAFGIQDYRVLLPAYRSGDRKETLVQTENLLAKFRNFSEDSENSFSEKKSAPSEMLSSSRQDALELFLEYMDNSLSLSAFSYLNDPLSPSSGMQSQLPILLAEYTFRTRRDVEDYLHLLEQTDTYFEGLLCFEQEKARAGCPAFGRSLEKVIEQCDTILTKEALEEETHFLQTTFLERLKKLEEAGEITAADFPAYMAQNNRLLKTVLLPAYEALGDGLLVLKDETILPKGLASYPGGRTYYEHLLFSSTGSARSISEIRTMLTGKMQDEYVALKEILTDAPALLQLDYEKELEKEFPFTSPEEILADLQQRMAADFPALPGRNTSPPALESVALGSVAKVSANAAPASGENVSFAGRFPKAAVKPVSPSLQDFTAPAFYLTPPLDDTSSNVIYINEKKTPSRLELYTTLAHEGYPGHLYQSVYYNLKQKYIENFAPSCFLRELLWYGGYQEGWALYVENISYDYASAIMESKENSLLAAAIQLEKHNRCLQLCLYSLMDIMIHYENADLASIGSLLKNFGITGEAAADRIYTYIAEEPCNYLKYYLGYLEILECKEKAEALWKENYSDLAFHTFFLETGPCSFPFLQKKLEETRYSSAPASSK